MRSALEESHAEKRSFAAEVHTAALDTGSVHSDAGSHCMLVEAAEAAVADTVALADWIGFVDNFVLPVGLAELADTAASIGHAAVADNDVLGTVDYAGIVALSSLVAVADTGVAVLDTVRSADTAEDAGTVGLVYTAEIVDNAEVAAGTADIVATTDWWPYSTVVTPNSCLCRLQQGKKVSYLRPTKSPLRAETLRLGIR